MELIEYAAAIGIICVTIFGIIALIYYSKVKKLMKSINIKSWKEISDHYSQIKFLKENGWKC